MYHQKSKKPCSAFTMFYVSFHLLNSRRKETKSVKAGLLTRASSYSEPSHTRAVKRSCTVVSQNRLHLQLRGQSRILTGFPIKSIKRHL